MLVNSSFGCLVLNPTLKRRCSGESDESVYNDVGEQQLHELQPEQHGVAINHETD